MTIIERLTFRIIENTLLKILYIKNEVIMYELSQHISEGVWNRLKLKYENPGILKIGEVSITELLIMCPILEKFPNLVPIKVKDVSNEESNHGLDFIIEDKSSEKYTFAFQAKVLRGDEYPEIAHISGRKKPESHISRRKKPEYQVEKVFQTQHKMRKEFGKDKYSAYYIFYNYLDCESEIFKSVKDHKNNSFTPLHGVTAAPIEDIYNYLTNIAEYKKENPRNIPSKYKKVDKISIFTRPWDYLFESLEAFNPKIPTLPKRKISNTFELIRSEYKTTPLRVEYNPIPLEFSRIPSNEIPYVMSPEEYISYFYGEDKEYLLSEINIPKYVIFGKVNFNIY